MGGGYFLRYSRLPVSVAWGAFEYRNGVRSLQELRGRGAHYARQHFADEPDPEIGCIILTEPFFLPRSQWTPAPADWAPNIVTGKGYSTDTPIGAAVWAKVQEALALQHHHVRETPVQYDAQYGEPYLTRAWLGQGAFRIVTLENYGRRCSMTGETTLPVLQAAHIRPVAEGGSHSAQNGLLLRADMHILFDQGLLGVSPDYRVQVSPRIHDAYLNGRVYYAHHGSRLRSLPSDPLLCPDPGLLEWHMDTRFVR